MRFFFTNTVYKPNMILYEPHMTVFCILKIIPPYLHVAVRINDLCNQRFKRLYFVYLCCPTKHAFHYFCQIS